MCYPPPSFRAWGLLPIMPLWSINYGQFKQTNRDLCTFTGPWENKWFVYPRRQINMLNLSSPSEIWIIVCFCWQPVFPCRWNGRLQQPTVGERGSLQRFPLNAHLDRLPAPPWESLLLRVGSKMESQNTEMKWGGEMGREGRDEGIEDIERKKAEKEKGERGKKETPYFQNWHLTEKLQKNVVKCYLRFHHLMVQFNKPSSICDLFHTLNKTKHKIIILHYIHQYNFITADMSLLQLNWELFWQFVYRSIPSSSHSSRALEALSLNRGSSHDVVFVLWLQGNK